MAANTPNYDLLLSGVLRDARRQPDPVAYLDGLHRAAFEAYKAGAEFIDQLSSEAGSSHAIQNVSTETLLQLYEAALQTLEAEAAQEAGTAHGSGAVRYGDFSGQPCTLG